MIDLNHPQQRHHHNIPFIIHKKKKETYKSPQM